MPNAKIQSVRTTPSEHPEMAVVLDPQSSGVTFPGHDWSIRSGEFQTGLSAGVNLIELNNGSLTVSILPTRGMGIWKARCNKLDIGWTSPVRHPVHPHFVDLHSRNGLGWLDGFNELIARCGLAFNGPPGHDDGANSPIESQLTLHGKIANLPAHSVEVFADEAHGTIGVSGVVDECTLFGPQLELRSTITTRPGSHSFTIRDEVTNLGATPAEMELLYHTNLGQPFLGAGSTFHCPAHTVTPRDARAAEGTDSYATYLAPTPGYAEQVYFFDLLADAEDKTLALLANRTGDLGVSLHFRKSQLPCFSLWKCTQPEQAGYVTGLEPGTNFPNFKSFERDQGRVISLAPGGTHVAELQLVVHSSADDIQKTQRRIREIQGAHEPELHKQPQPPFCPAIG